VGDSQLGLKMLQALSVSCRRLSDSHQLALKSGRALSEGPILPSQRFDALTAGRQFHGERLELTCHRKRHPVDQEDGALLTDSVR
jgi:hypothetical protein